MACLLDFARLLVLLSLACWEDLRLVTAQGNASPVINMSLDPRRKTLSWNSQRNVTGQECQIDFPPDFSTRLSPQLQGNDSYSCQFPNAVLHRGATLTVRGTADGEVFQSTLDFQNPGKEGSGAANFSCLIYNTSCMSCSWRPGPAAPADVQYHLSRRTSWSEDEVECLQYAVNSAGTHVGCHFGELLAPRHSDTYVFFVSGTSRETAIQFLDFAPLRAIDMAKYNPPANVTASYNGSHHIIRWDNPRMGLDMSSNALYYELDIQRKGSSPRTDTVFQRGCDDNVYLVPRSAARAPHTVRVRVRFVYGHIWSDWSATHHFGPPSQGFRGEDLVSVGPMVGTAALLIVVLMVTCTRFSLIKKLFPPVPQANMEVKGTPVPFPEIAWNGVSPPPCLQEPEDVITVQETQPFMRGDADIVSPAPTHHDVGNARSERRPLDV